MIILARSSSGQKVDAGENCADVIMNMAAFQAPDIAQLLHMARDRSAIGRSSLIDAITDLVSEEEQTLSDQEQALVTDIMCKLLHDVETSVRGHLAERLATVPGAPTDLISLLANDEIAVARPILLHSTVLGDPELISIIKHRGWEHQVAIAMRRTLSAEVSECLVETDNTSVIASLLENQNAEISKTTMQYLVEESQRVDSYQNPLVRRRDLPPELAQRMHAWVSEALRQYIDTNFEIDAAPLAAAIDGATKDAVAEITNSANDPSAADRLADHITSPGIDPKVLVKLLREGEISLFESMLSRISELDLRNIQKLIYPAGGEGLAVVCRTAMIPKPIFASIFILSRQARPGDHNVEKDELKKVLKIYDNLSDGKARSILKSWRNQPAYETLKRSLSELSSLAVLQ